MVRALIDTNIFVYWMLPGDAEKKHRAGQLIKQLGVDAVCTIQVVREFTNVALGKFNGVLGTVELDDTYDKLFLPILAEHKEDTEFLKRSAYLKKRYELSFYDALIVQSAIDLGCDRIYSEDLQHGQVIEGVEIIDPFC